MKVNRRKFLTVGCVGGTGVLAGCVGLEPVEDVTEHVSVKSVDGNDDFIEDVVLERAFISEGLFRGDESVIEFRVDMCECSLIERVRAASERELSRRDRERDVITDSILVESVSRDGFQTEYSVEGLLDGEVVDSVDIVLSWSDSIATV